MVLHEDFGVSRFSHVTHQVVAPRMSVILNHAQPGKSLWPALTVSRNISYRIMRTNCSLNVCAGVPAGLFALLQIALVGIQRLDTRTGRGSHICPAIPSTSTEAGMAQLNPGQLCLAFTLGFCGRWVLWLLFVSVAGYAFPQYPPLHCNTLQGKETSVYIEFHQSFPMCTHLIHMPCEHSK
jgi:hypothetical protein